MGELKVYTMTANQITSDSSGVDRRTFVKAAGVGATVGVAGCLGGDNGDDDVVRVGAVYPLTGPLGEVGERIQDALETTVDQIINQAQPDLEGLLLAEEEGLPNLDGAEVEVLFSDHRGDAGEGRTEAENMIHEEDVDVLYGAYHSAVTETISAAAEREGIPHVTGESSSPELTERGLEWFWRTGPHDAIYSRNMFEFFEGLNEREDAGLETVAIIHEDTEFGAVSADTQVELADEYGYDIVEGPIAYTAEEVTSLTSELERIQQADPDVLLPTSYVRDALIMMEDMRAIDYYPDLLMAQNTGHNDPEFMSETDLSEYVLSRSDFAADYDEAIPEIGQYDQWLQEEAGVALDGVMIRTWGGFLMTLKAIDNAGSTEPEAIQDALNDLQVEPVEAGLPYGCSFDDTGQNAEASGIIIQVRDGEERLVWPFEDAPDGNLEYPIPDWEDRE